MMQQNSESVRAQEVNESVDVVKSLGLNDGEPSATDTLSEKYGQDVDNVLLALSSVLNNPNLMSEISNAEGPSRWVGYPEKVADELKTIAIKLSSEEPERQETEGVGYSLDVIQHALHIASLGEELNDADKRGLQAHAEIERVSSQLSVDQAEEATVQFLSSSDRLTTEANEMSKTAASYANNNPLMDRYPALRNMVSALVGGVTAFTGSLPSANLPTPTRTPTVEAIGKSTTAYSGLPTRTPTPRPTATPRPITTPEPISTPETTRVVKLAVMNGSTNVRAGAGVNFAVLQTAAAGAEYQLTGATKAVSGYTWSEVDLGTVDGWIRNDLFTTRTETLTSAGPNTGGAVTSPEATPVPAATVVSVEDPGKTVEATEVVPITLELDEYLPASVYESIFGAEKIIVTRRGTDTSPAIYEENVNTRGIPAAEPQLTPEQWQTIIDQLHVTYEGMKAEGRWPNLINPNSYDKIINIFNGAYSRDQMSALINRIKIDLAQFSSNGAAPTWMISEVKGSGEFPTYSELTISVDINKDGENILLLIELMDLFSLTQVYLEPDADPYALSTALGYMQQPTEGAGSIDSLSNDSATAVFYNRYAGPATDIIGAFSQ